jgi:hypothetical protein
MNLSAQTRRRLSWAITIPTLLIAITFFWSIWFNFTSARFAGKYELVIARGTITLRKSEIPEKLQLPSHIGRNPKPDFETYSEWRFDNTRGIYCKIQLLVPLIIASTLTWLAWRQDPMAIRRARFSARETGD